MKTYGTYYGKRKLSQFFYFFVPVKWLKSLEKVIEYYSDVLLYDVSLIAAGDSKPKEEVVVNDFDGKL